MNLNIKEIIRKPKKIPEKTCMYTILNDDFYVGFEVFMHSFLHHNPWFTYDFVILDLELSEATKKKCRRIYPNIIWKKPNYSAYKDVNFGNTHDRLKCTFYFLDCFLLNEYERVVSVDLDMVIQDSLEPVFSNGGDFCAVKGWARKVDRLASSINAGLFVINKKYLNQKTYTALLDIAQEGFSMPEQRTMNIFFDGCITYLPKRYNCEKRMVASKRFKKVLDDAAVIHYVGENPWSKHKKGKEASYGEIERKWFAWHERVALKIHK